MQQTLIRRARTVPTSKPAPAPTPEPAQAVSASKPSGPALRTRLRTTSTAASQVLETRQKILEDLQAISSLDAAIDRAMEEKQVALARIEENMRQQRLTVIDDGKLLAEIAESFTRQERTIDPRKYRNKVTGDQFWESVSVKVAKAKDFLGDKEINAISDVVPARSLGYSLKIRDLPKKK